MRRLVAVTAAALLGLAGCGDPFPEESGPDPGEVAEDPGPLILTAAQLDELVPTLDDVASSMFAEVVEGEPGGFGIVVDVPPDATTAEWTYWSMDGGDRTMGVEPVDFASVQFVLVEDDAEVQPVLDAVVGFDAVYWRWLPTEVAGATAAQESEWIPYEGEPDDEPEFNSVLAHRDRLIVIVTTAGSDAGATGRAADSLAHVIFEQARRFAGE